MGKFYAVKKGRRNGIFNTWDECRAQIKGLYINHFRHTRKLMIL